LWWTWHGEHLPTVGEDAAGCFGRRLDLGRLRGDDHKIGLADLGRIRGGVEVRHPLAAGAADLQAMLADGGDVLGPAVDGPDIEPGVCKEPSIDRANGPGADDGDAHGGKAPAGSGR
jgi:hypothetical protein